MVLEIRMIHGFSFWYGTVRLMSADELRDWLLVFLIFRKGAHWNLFHFCIVLFLYHVVIMELSFSFFAPAKWKWCARHMHYTNTCTFIHILSYSFSHLLLSPLAILIINTAVYMLFIQKNVFEKKNIVYALRVYTRAK